MPLVELVTGTETLEQRTISAYEYYVPHSKCPMMYQADSSHKLRFPRLATLEKLGVAGPTGEVISRISSEVLPCSNAKSQVAQNQGFIPGFRKVVYELPNNLIIRVELKASANQFGGHHRHINILFKVADYGPLIQMHFRDGFNLPFIIKGRLIRLPADYVLKHDLLPTPLIKGTIGDTIVDSLVRIDELMKGELDLTETVSETVVLNGESINLSKVRKRKSIQKF